MASGHPKPQQDLLDLLKVTGHLYFEPVMTSKVGTGDEPLSSTPSLVLPRAQFWLPDSAVVGGEGDVRRVPPGTGGLFPIKYFDFPWSLSVIFKIGCWSNTV